MPLLRFGADTFISDALSELSALDSESMPNSVFFLKDNVHGYLVGYCLHCVVHWPRYVSENIYFNFCRKMCGKRTESFLECRYDYLFLNYMFYIVHVIEVLLHLKCKIYTYFSKECKRCRHYAKCLTYFDILSRRLCTEIDNGATP